MSKNTNLMSKNIVRKPVAINNIEVWMAMSKGNFLRKWFGRMYTVFHHACKANILWTNLRSILSTVNWINKKTKNKIESQKQVLEMVRAIGASVGYECGRASMYILANIS